MAFSASTSWSLPSCHATDGFTREGLALGAGSWDAPMEAKLRALGRRRHVAERGLAAAGDQADTRLEELRDSFADFEDELEWYVSRRHRPKGEACPK